MERGLVLTKPIVLTSGEVMIFSHCTEKLMSFKCIQDNKSLSWCVQQQLQHPHSMSSGRPSGLEVIHFVVWMSAVNTVISQAHKKNPIFEVLNTLIPTVIDGDTQQEDIEKALLYFDSESACFEAVKVLKKMLPSHLRGLVHSYSSTILALW